MHLQPASLCIGLHQFEAYTTPAQFLERVQTIGTFHVQHRYRTRCDLSGSMMVADDEIHANAVGIFHFLHRLDTAVKRNNERATFLFGGVDTFGGDAVTFCIAIRDVVYQIVGLGAQERVHKRHGSSTVHIVVAIDHDALMIINSLAQSIHSRSHITHQERVMQTVQRRTNVCPRFCTGM